MKKTTDFLKKLKKNNKKEWFDKNRPEYEEAKKEFIRLIEEVLMQSIKLEAVRQEIDYHFNDFKKILAQKEFKKYFKGKLSDEEKLVNPPKGYDKENPAVEFLKNKHFIVVHEVNDKILLSPKFLKYAAD